MNNENYVETHQLTSKVFKLQYLVTKSLNHQCLFKVKLLPQVKLIKQCWYTKIKRSSNFS